MRESDCSIIEELILGGFKENKTVEQLNRVRKHKGIVNLYDEVSNNDRCIEEMTLEKPI